jgi:hypothetical protein
VTSVIISLGATSDLKLRTSSDTLIGLRAEISISFNLSKRRQYLYHNLTMNTLAN